MGQFETLHINQELTPEEKLAIESLENIDGNVLAMTLKETNIPIIETNKENNKDLVRFSNFCTSYLEITDTKFNLAQLKNQIENEGEE